MVTDPAARSWVEETTAAAARALSGRRELRFRGMRPHLGLRPLAAGAPHLVLDAEDASLASHRGLTDALAQRLRDSDPAVHRLLAPAAAINRMVFEMLEQFRVEARVPRQWPGMRGNISRRFAAWRDAYERAGLLDSEGGLLIMTIALMCRAQVVGEPIPEHLSGRTEAIRAELGPVFADEIAGLRRQIDSQRAYGMHAVAIARMIAERVTMVDAARRETDTAADAPGDFALWLDFDEGGDDVMPAPATDGGVRGAGGGGYRVFTTRYDEVVDPASLVRAAQLTELRERLDERLRAQPVSVPRLARMLHARLAEPEDDDWLAEQEQGHVDGRRLARIVSSPGERRVFRLRDEPPRAQALISFLIDCSGSMRAIAPELGTLVEIFVRAAELAGVQSEVLGFTTRSWNGGLAARDWQRAGRPAEPGRLAELRHLVFKAADQRLRRRRRVLGALLKPDLFREGVDGEGLQWAIERAMAQPVRRRIIAVISDGSPMESATLRCNSGDPLDRHLAEVVERWDGRHGLRIVGLGVGLDLSPYYRQRLALSLDRGLDNRLLWQVAGKLTEPTH
ncbi:MAG: cobalt chelatase [Burkholderiaceae bacterium]